MAALIARGTRAETHPISYSLVLISSAILLIVSPSILTTVLAITLLSAGVIKFPSHRYLLSVALALVPYAMGPYLGSSLGIRFAPILEEHLYLEIAGYQLAGVLLIAVVMLNVPAISALNGYLKMAFRTEFSQAPGITLRVARMYLGLVGAVNLIIAIRGSLSSGQLLRHQLSEQFILNSGAIGNALSLCISVLVLRSAFSSQGNRLDWWCLVLFWLPDILAGDRQYLALMVLSGLVFAYQARQGNLKSQIRVLSVGLSALVLVLSSVFLWTTDSTIALNEWILPSHFMTMLFPQWQTLASLGVNSVWEQWPLLLPKTLRPYEVNTLSEITLNLRLVNVDVGGSPWAETFVGEAALSALTLVSMAVIVLLAASLVGKSSPEGAVVSWLLLLLWGRSFAWGMVLTILLVGVVIFALRRLLKSAVRSEPT